MPKPFRIGVSSGFKTAAPGTIEPVLERLIDPLPQVEWAFFDAGGGEPVARFRFPSRANECQMVGTSMVRSHPGQGHRS